MAPDAGSSEMLSMLHIAVDGREDARLMQKMRCDGVVVARVGQSIYMVVVATSG